MPTYVFRCAGHCADVEQVHTMASVPDAVDCAHCGGVASRIIGSPALGVGNTAAMRLQDTTRASADRPAVVSAVPRRGRGTTPISTNPMHRRLPRP
ncbi:MULTISPECIES: FmdB family zinc ribbon protein [unclassified Gordonia (in: high G+C Gram-positive bacteria)]